MLTFCCENVTIHPKYRNSDFYYILLQGICCVPDHVEHIATCVFIIDDQQDATFWFIYLYPISSTCFGRCFGPSSGVLDCIYSFRYSPPMLLPAGVMDEMFHLVHDTGWQQHRWTISEAVNTVKCSWWWTKTSPETCRADWVQINKPKFASCWSSFTNYTNDAGT